jgi:hypothetical protein
MGHASKGRIFVFAGDIRNMYTVLVGNQDTLQREEFSFLKEI